MICGETLKDRRKNELVIKMNGVKPMNKLLRSQRLRWFGYVERMSKEKALAIVMKITVKVTKTLEAMDCGC